MRLLGDALRNSPEFELNKDNYYDLSVRLLSIEQFRANLTIKSIHEEIGKAPASVPSQAIKEEPVKEPVEPKVVKKSPSSRSFVDNIFDFWGSLFGKFTGKMVEKFF